MKNIAAFTAETSYPAFVSINEVENGVSIAVRSEGKIRNEMTWSGDQAEIVLSHAMFDVLITQIMKNYTRRETVDPAQTDLSL